MTTPSEARYRALLDTRGEGETLVALAQRQGVNLHTLYWWHQRFAKQARERRSDGAVGTALVPVEAGGLDLSAILSSSNSSFEVALRGSGHVVRVPTRFDVGALRRLVETLEALEA